MFAGRAAAAHNANIMNDVGASMPAITSNTHHRRASAPPILLAALCLLPLWCAAQTKPRPAAVECRVQTSPVDQSAGKLTVRVRANCPVTREQLKTAMRDLAPSAFAAGARPAELRVDLGRIVDHPWLSAALARAALASKEWDKTQGKPRQRNINQFAATLLRLGGTLDELMPGWSLNAISTEKVLVQPARAMAELKAVPGDKAQVPYDAQLVLTYVAATTDAVQAPAAPAVIPPARLDE